MPSKTDTNSPTRDPLPQGRPIKKTKKTPKRKAVRLTHDAHNESIRIISKYIFEEGIDEQTRLDNLKWLYSVNWRGFKKPETWNFFASEGYLLNLEFGNSVGVKFPEGICSEACKSGDSDILKFLLSKGYPLTTDCYKVACSDGYMEIVKFLIENDCPRDYEAVNAACSNGKYGLLDFLLKNKFPVLGTYPYALVISCEHIECLYTLMENKVEFNADVCEDAAKWNSLTSLRILRRHGCRWDRRVYKWAFERKNKEMLKYIFEEGLDIGDKDIMNRITSSYNNNSMNELFEGEWHDRNYANLLTRVNCAVEWEQRSKNRSK